MLFSDYLIGRDRSVNLVDEYFFLLVDLLKSDLDLPPDKKTLNFIEEEFKLDRNKENKDPNFGRKKQKKSKNFNIIKNFSNPKFSKKENPEKC